MLLKSVNLQYDRLVRWDDGTNNSSTKHLMLQVLFFFHKILQNSLQKPFQFFFYKITKMKVKSFEFLTDIRSYEKKKKKKLNTIYNTCPRDVDGISRSRDIPRNPGIKKSRD